VFNDYSQTIEGSMHSMEHKARAITQELHQGTDERSRQLLSELERVKSFTETESDRALNDVRSRFSNVTGELTREFDSLSTRLTSATEETRKKAAEAAAQLASEQARIREEAARLPAATRETAESMRRALADQLKALDQLSQLSGRTVSLRDVVPPEAPPAPALSAPQRQISSPPHAAIPAPPPQATEPPTRGRGATGRPENREGWSLGDLLARASSQEEEAAPPQREPFHLDVGAIARAIDASTASAIWNRFRAGQRNIMVRSIYAPETRIVFDEVSKRIKADAELAQTVQRYLSDFERIIKEADARDGSGRLAHTHLVSDTGRVYLFLAHAAGRPI
jgi:hypothetical protein